MKGQYTVEQKTGSSYCVDCLAGHYSTKPSDTDCERECPTGYYSEPRAFECIMCGPYGTQRSLYHVSRSLARSFIRVQRTG